MDGPLLFPTASHGGLGLSLPASRLGVVRHKFGIVIALEIVLDVVEVVEAVPLVQSVFVVGGWRRRCDGVLGQVVGLHVLVFDIEPVVSVVVLVVVVGAVVTHGGAVAVVGAGNMDNGGCGWRWNVSTGLLPKRRRDGGARGRGGEEANTGGGKEAAAISWGLKLWAAAGLGLGLGALSALVVSRATRFPTFALSAPLSALRPPPSRYDVRQGPRLDAALPA